MTNKEALEECKSRLVCKYGVSAQTLSQDFWEICVEALEKQIPKKPNKDLCSMCGAVVNIDESYITYSMNYSIEYRAGFCPSCGQKIDWE